MTYIIQYWIQSVYIPPLVGEVGLHVHKLLSTCMHYKTHLSLQAAMRQSSLVSTECETYIVHYYKLYT